MKLHGLDVRNTDTEDELIFLTQGSSIDDAYGEPEIVPEAGVDAMDEDSYRNAYED